MKRINLFFYYQQIYRQTKITDDTDERFTDGAFPSVINLQTEYVSYADGKISLVKLLNLVVFEVLISKII